MSGNATIQFERKYDRKTCNRVGEAPEPLVVDETFIQGITIALRDAKVHLDIFDDTVFIKVVDAKDESISKMEVFSCFADRSVEVEYRIGDHIRGTEAFKARD